MTANAFDCNNIDWTRWTPKERAVLCIIRIQDQVMLIHKKTGLGAGKINAPGGRIEPGESPYNAAVRETEEEIGLTPYELTQVGELFFDFTDGYSLHGTVFIAAAYSGIPRETCEAKPFWCSIDAIPYDQMWEDDRFWLPFVLKGKVIKGYFIFSDDKMLSKNVFVS